MKTLQEQYNLIKEGKGHKDVFLKEAKKKFPNMINKAATYDQAAYILKKRSVISENYIDVKPINTIEATPKQSWEEKFSQFINEAGEKSLNPIVNNEENYNKQDENVSADPNYKFDIENGSYGSYKNVSAGVENIASHNYDYSPSVENINNVNGQELLQGFYTEMKNNPDMTKTEIQEKVIKNLAKDPLHYVKEGQFGVEGLGYTEQKSTESGDKNYGGSGYSEKTKDSSNKMEIVKESIGGVVTTGNNPWTEIVNDIIREEEDLPMDENEAAAARQEAIEASQEAAGIQEKKKDHDGDGDIDSDDYLAARDKAIKAAKSKKPKKESIETKLAEIGKAGDITKLEAQLEFLSNHIDEKIQRVSSINEDDNLKELVDKKKMKDMQKEIKLLEKRKGKMEKMYEKMCGKKYQQKEEVVDEQDEVSWNEKNNPTRGAAGERDPKKVGQSTAAYSINK